MDAWQFGVTFVGCSIAAGILGMIAVRAVVRWSTLKHHHGVVGGMMPVIGTLYAVLLGLVIVETQHTHQEARMMAATEANAAADIFRVAYALPDDQRRKLHKLLSDYVNIVITDEWNSAENGAFNEHTDATLTQIWWNVIDSNPKTIRDQINYEDILNQLQKLCDSRRYRFVVGKHGISQVLWGVLVAGGFLTVIFTFFFGVERLSNQIILTTLFTLLLALNVMLVALFSNPYKGELKVKPEAFVYNQQVFQKLLTARPDN
jgi:hypothetical protein